MPDFFSRIRPRISFARKGCSSVSGSASTCMRSSPASSLRSACRRILVRFTCTSCGVSNPGVSNAICKATSASSWRFSPSRMTPRILASRPLSDSGRRSRQRQRIGEPRYSFPASKGQLPEGERRRRESGVCQHVSRPDYLRFLACHRFSESGVDFGASRKRSLTTSTASVRRIDLKLELELDLGRGFAGEVVWI